MRHKIRIGALALLVLTVPIFGEKPPKPQKPETPSVDNRVKEIDKSWMATIHGNPSDPKQDAAKTDDSSPNVTSTQDSAKEMRTHPPPQNLVLQKNLMKTRHDFAIRAAIQSPYSRMKTSHPSWELCFAFY